eukprot:gnl/MRDRNA2_/MRDRNA2_199717_c0_seq1.p1 gnl/MRDRNA2_/MRDRNA2_199717_c0~~gnl/MRDRNA2_/MRDRNA2_199717_c0_seq1.p1  ORF type:complete len:528 (-),score=55.31 gnl/MRDRNA2_/MRDRNA2_199717_c0_seq1:211-1569(-)
MTEEELLTNVHSGVITLYDDARGYGFLKNRRISRLCGRDVYFHRGLFPNKDAGDSVQFGVEYDVSGRLRARDAQELTSGKKMPDYVATGSNPSWHDGVESKAQGGSSVESSPLTRRELLSQVHRGVLWQYNEISGYGFIRTPEIYALCGVDVYVPRGQCEGKRVGDEVCFAVELNGEGMPRAWNVQLVTKDREGERNAADSKSKVESILTHEDLWSGELRGTIISFDESRSSGYIRLPQGLRIRVCSGGDVYFQSSVCRCTPSVGQSVQFALLAGGSTAKNKPRARYVRAACEDDILETGVTIGYGGLKREDLASRDLSGVVVAFDDAKGFGFIRNRTVHQLCGYDVFFHRTHCWKCGLGDAVRFGLEFEESSGRPRTTWVLLYADWKESKWFSSGSSGSAQHDWDWLNSESFKSASSKEFSGASGLGSDGPGALIGLNGEWGDADLLLSCN